MRACAGGGRGGEPFGRQEQQAEAQHQELPDGAEVARHQGEAAQEPPAAAAGDPRAHQAAREEEEDHPEGAPALEKGEPETVKETSGEGPSRTVKKARRWCPRPTEEMTNKKETPIINAVANGIKRCMKVLGCF